MLSKQTKGDLKSLVKGNLLFDEPMKKHTSFRIGGPADALFVPIDEDDLKNILIFANENNVPINVIGNGTNLLVSDDGIAGIVIKMSDCFDSLIISGSTVITGAGYTLSKLSRLVADYGLSGLEFAVGIPGTIGGAVVMNAGAHGSSMSNVVTKVKVMDICGKVREMFKKDLKFEYRKSELQKCNRIVLGAEMELIKDDTGDIKKKMSKYLQWRRENQPLDMPNAGSIFKNPKNDFAGRLIDIAGCKGMKIGDAQVSELKANFIVNEANATASDVLKLMNVLQKIVLQKYNVRIVSEIKTMGRWVNLKEGSDEH
ncbi:MAG: UDP-N-acetylenolpyruvoylglucosamine reductase [Candidatus Latescibacterota bacterium]|nr:MAG: UDP-N-acetylenolpyruvoylglucosamine reductase [Candidatus Latescibacterota bacterium]